jgi:predicted restriction endonuclease
MPRKNEFNRKTKRAAIERQNGVCAFCGVPLNTPWTDGDYTGYAHHLRPIRHSGTGDLDNCVYLCWGHHLLLGHGMAPFGIDPQGGGSDAWVQLEKDDFPHWDG